MEYKKIDCNSFNIHTIKVNRFKTTKIEVIFRNNVNKETIAINSFLASFLCESTKKYSTRKKLAIKCEDLYKCFYYAFTNKIGDCLNTVFSLNFINPEYIDEKNYLNDLIEFLFDSILNGNFNNKEADINTFNITKNNILLDIDSIEENADKKAINNALKKMDERSLSSLSVLGTKEDINKITPEKLYEAYIKLLNESIVDIFVIGNTNMDNIVKLIKQYYHNHQINSKKINYYIDNNIRKKSIKCVDKSSLSQSQLVVLYNLKNLTKDEKEITFHLLNYILGSGGLSSKLYKYVREDNSLCYRISSMYFKYDNLLCIASSLTYDNINDAIKLIKKSIKEMQKGIFSEDDINDAKKNMLLSLNVNKNNPNAILASYEFNYFLGNYLINEKIDKLNAITKEDIVKLANKIVDNTYYVLSEDKNERN